MWKQVVGRVVSRRWTVGHMSYSIEDLRTIRKQAFFSSNYNLFSLSQETRAWIISLGIWKQATKQLYRHSRGGRNLFNRIEKIISTSRKENMVNRERTTTLLAINMDLRPSQISLLLVNARSIIKKNSTLSTIHHWKGHWYKYHNWNMDKNGGWSKYH